MASSAPPILPLSSPPPPPLTSTIPIPAYRAFIDQTLTKLSLRRPWSELLDCSAFSKPESLSDAVARLGKNHSYFCVNYLILISLTIVVFLFSHPGALFVLLCLFVAWSFFFLLRPSDSPLFLFGRTFSHREILTGLVILSAFVVFLTNVGSVLMSALMIGLGIVCVHGAFRVPDDLFLDEQEQSYPSFLWFLGSPANNASAASTVASTVAPRTS